ncbi:lipase member K-like [Trichosurus vulpecula]|uniref:lipase member K-like n=1 Tax=Trichosurus vulpecula TaxID=9337 RepID=UPI00186B3BFA|nr:lipase member K-like [Trichosurus vulpecula]
MDPVKRGRHEIWHLLVTACWMLVFGTANGGIKSKTVRNPEANMNISQIISYWGYPSEAYDVVTEDGFILGVYRIPYGKGHSERTAQRPIFYLQHGMFVSASSWVANPPYTSLAFTLADSGYDVWMGNSRGNIWSRKHMRYSPESPEFWAFSFDEMAKYDLVATLNFIMNKTNQEKLYYVGHAQGTTIALAAFSTNPKLAERIKMFFALAPVVSVQHSRGPLKTLISIPTSLFKVIFGRKELFPKSAFNQFLSSQVCNRKGFNVLCTDFLFRIYGYDRENMNMSRLDVYLSQNSAGTSVQNIVHWSQILHSAKFQAYDWGNPAANMAHFNQVTPPLYDLGAMKIPIAIWSGQQDRFASPKEVENLLPKLPNLIYHKKIPYYNHIDFLLGLDAPQEFFHEILYLIKTYMKHYRPCHFLVSGWEAGGLQGWEKQEIQWWDSNELTTVLQGTEPSRAAPTNSWFTELNLKLGTRSTKLV